jgi:outer membrane protein TolC
MPEIRKTLGRQALALASAALVGGCAVGPDFKAPAAPQAAAQFARAEPAPAAPQAEPDAAFWQRFQDPQLTQLVERALGDNQDLQVALARLDGAQALLRESRFDQFPTVTLSGRATQQKLSESEAFYGPRSQRSYADLRGWQQRLALAQANAANQQDTLHLVRLRLEHGSGTEFDLARAQAQLEATRSRIPALQAQIAMAQHRLAVLTGQVPEALIAQLEQPSALPQLPPAIDPGTPAGLLRRRPDVAAAEARLHAATARIGVATADLFPRLSLGGLLGSTALHGGSLFEGGSATGSVFLGVDWSFLDVGRVRARIAASEAGAQAALAQYQQAVLLALEDTENALVRLQRTRAEDAHLAQAAEQRQRAEQLALRRYQLGSVGLYEVLDAQRDLYAAQDAAADSRARGLRAAVALYQALAGGWDGRLPPA